MNTTELLKKMQEYGERVKEARKNGGTDYIILSEFAKKEFDKVIEEAKKKK